MKGNIIYGGFYTYKTQVNMNSIEFFSNLKLEKILFFQWIFILHYIMCSQILKINVCRNKINT